MRTRIYEIVTHPKRGDNASYLYDLFIVIVSVISIVPALFHANRINESAQHALEIIDIVTVYILCFDYLLNWMTFDIARGKRGEWIEFLKYPFTLIPIINLLSILPTLNLLPSGFLFLRALRIVRLFRYSRQLAVIVNIFIQERKILSSILVLALAYIFATALIMFTFEPETFDTFVDALYWSTITLTTVGFGDITPASDLGYILTSITSIVGIYVLALPAGIVTGGFLQQLKRKEEDAAYYAVGFFKGMDFSKFCFTPKKLKKHFKEHPKLRLYLLFIVAGVALNYVLCAAFSYLEQPLWLDTTGTALVACVLDPAAGIILSFINNLIIAVYQDSPQNILYFSESALVALSYGYLFKQGKNGKLPYQNAGKTLCVIILIQSAITLFLSFTLNGGTFTTIFENGYRDVLCEAGMNYYVASLFAIIFDRTIDALSVFGIVVLLVKILETKNFVARKWLEDNCPPEKVDTQRTPTPIPPRTKHKEPVQTGILSCENEAVVLSRAGLKYIASEMKKEAKAATDPQDALKCLSAAETIYLLEHSNIKNEKEFKELFLKKMQADECRSGINE